MTDKLHDLIRRLEGATEGSRELDARIHAALHPTQRLLLDPGSVGPEKREAVYGTLSDLPLDGWSDYEAVCRTIEAPAYTESLDAAMTLVPEGARVRELGQWWNIDKPGGWFCNIMRWEYDERMNLVERCYVYGFSENDDNKMPKTASTAALALCIAALKARAAAEEAP